MSKPRGKGNSFPPLQKRIILHLAQAGPQNINETKTAIKGHYKSTWIAFDILRKKGLITEVSSKLYRGKHYPRFWVTELGIYLALYEGAKPKDLLRTTLVIYPENKNLQFLIEAVPILGENAFEVLYLTALNNGHIEQADVFSILAKQMQKPLTTKEIDQFIAVLNKYPETHRLSVDYVNQVTKNLKKISDKLSINQKNK